ncbi:hypothetical protein [Aquabacterium sp. OR-4]|uniref:hypothetical protein n=1 Tax=Aquabacterium sp. OR-4 TaxID=2978127 RepID=UPI0028C8ACD4|nr:hypothetical protein [Aquabacterium sp. OR-4]MDT7838926.1 hypothetical protein [Aquabacterium sp. OR-4]
MPGFVCAMPADGHPGAAAARHCHAGVLWLAMALIVLLQFGPLIGLVGYRLSENPLWPLSAVLRDVLVAALVLLALHALCSAPVHRRWPASLRWAALLVVGVGLASLSSDSGLFTLALNLRRLALVPLLFLAVSLLPWSRQQLAQLMALLVASSVLVALLGLVDRLGGDGLWTEWLRIEAFTAANGLDRYGKIPFDQNGRYHSWDLEPVLGGPVRRALSSYLEPTTLAAGMAAALALLLARQARGHRQPWALALVLACGLLTVSKGFVLYLLLLLAWRVLGVPAPQHVLQLSLGAVLVALAVVARGLSEGAFSHLGGVATALAHLADGHWLGEGVGEVGNYANNTEEVGAESGLGNAIAQIGVVAFLPLLWLHALARQTLDQARRSGDAGGPWLASWALFWTASYVFSASSQGVGGNALGFLALALYLHPAASAERP